MSTSTMCLNLFSLPILAFALGCFSRLIRSDLSLPKEVFAALATYLLFAIGIKGGVELASTHSSTIALPIVYTVLLGCLTPVTAFVLLRYLGSFSQADAAGIAAHYGSVSAVTFMAAQKFVMDQGHSVEGFMSALLTILESPGIAIALLLGLIGSEQSRSIKSALHEVFTSRGFLLMIGGLVLGSCTGEKNWSDVSLFFDSRGPVFRGILCLFLLHMGTVAGERLADLKKVGWFLFAFALFVPVVHGLLGVYLGTLAGLSLGGTTVLGTMAASASYIAAPPAVKLTLPEANPTYYLTCSLGITFPFNLLLGIPLYYQFAQFLTAHQW
jgi:uncharacterized protein